MQFLPKHEEHFASLGVNETLNILSYKRVKLDPVAAAGSTFNCCIKETLLLI